MRDNEDHPHHQTETSNHDDGPPDGNEADWLKWRSRMNRHHRFQRERALTPKPRGEPPPPAT